MQITGATSLAFRTISGALRLTLRMQLGHPNFFLLKGKISVEILIQPVICGIMWHFYLLKLPRWTSSVYIGSLRDLIQTHRVRLSCATTVKLASGWPLTPATCREGQGQPRVGLNISRKNISGFTLDFRIFGVFSGLRPNFANLTKS